MYTKSYKGWSSIVIPKASQILIPVISQKLLNQILHPFENQCQCSIASSLISDPNPWSLVPDLLSPVPDPAHLISVPTSMIPTPFPLLWSPTLRTLWFPISPIWSVIPPFCFLPPPTSLRPWHYKKISVSDLIYISCLKALKRPLRSQYTTDWINLRHSLSRTIGRLPQTVMYNWVSRADVTSCDYQVHAF